MRFEELISYATLRKTPSLENLADSTVNYTDSVPTVHADFMT